MTILKNIQARASSNPPIIRKGGASVVYRISPREACKVLAYRTSDPNVFFLRNGRDALDELTEEFDMSNEVFNAGISSPRPFGLVDVNISGLIYPGFSMEYIPGERVSTLQTKNPAQYLFARRLMERELAKACNRGFIAGDSGKHNTLFVPRRNKAYLIDFSDWEFRTSDRSLLA